MANVVSIILIFDRGEEREQREKEFNDFIYLGDRKLVLSYIDDEKLGEWYFGNYSMAGNIYIGSYKTFNVNDYLLYLKTNVHWEYPESVQAIIYDESSGILKYICYSITDLQLPNEITQND